jgi:hypothetical protein
MSTPAEQGALASSWSTRATLGLVLLGFTPFGDEGLRPRREAAPKSEQAEPRAKVVFEGMVVDAAGAPVEDALVTSSAGGRALTGRMGTFRLEAAVPIAAHTVEITVADGSDRDAATSTSIALAASSGAVRVAPLALTDVAAPSWLPTFGGLPGTDERVSALTVFDDGTGPALYAAGTFTIAGGVAANRVARWDGSQWTALGVGTDDHVLALATFDDGRGTALYAGGEFTTAGGSPRARSRGGTARAGRLSGAASTPPSTRWRCSTTAAERRSTRAARSTPPAA